MNKQRFLATVVAVLILILALLVWQRSTSNTSEPSSSESASQDATPTAAQSAATVQNAPVQIHDQIRDEKWIVSSKIINFNLPQQTIVPAGPTQGRPLLIDLHGKGTPEAPPSVPEEQAALVAAGSRAPVVVKPADDGQSFWMNRKSGRWADYITDEAIPQAIERYNLDPKRIAISGISMGGSGAMHLAQRNPTMFCSVSVHSPGIWSKSSDVIAGSFDSVQQFKTDNPATPILKGNDSTFKKIPIWIDVGDKDPFAQTTVAVAKALKAHGAKVTFNKWPGHHDAQYWRLHQREYIPWIVDRLAECR